MKLCGFDSMLELYVMNHLLVKGDRMHRWLNCINKTDNCDTFFEHCQDFPFTAMLKLFLFLVQFYFSFFMLS